MTTDQASPAGHAREALGLRLREIRREAGLTGRALAALRGRRAMRCLGDRQRSAALALPGPRMSSSALWLWTTDQAWAAALATGDLTAIVRAN